MKDAFSLANEIDPQPGRKAKQVRLSETTFRADPPESHVVEYSKPHKLQIPFNEHVWCRMKGATLDYTSHEVTVFLDYGEYDVERLTKYFLALIPDLRVLKINMFFRFALFTIAQRTPDGKWHITPYNLEGAN